MKKVNNTIEFIKTCLGAMLGILMAYGLIFALQFFLPDVYRFLNIRLF